MYTYAYQAAEVMVFPWLKRPSLSLWNCSALHIFDLCTWDHFSSEESDVSLALMANSYTLSLFVLGRKWVAVTRPSGYVLGSTGGVTSSVIRGIRLIYIFLGNSPNHNPILSNKWKQRGQKILCETWSKSCPPRHPCLDNERRLIKSGTTPSPNDGMEN